MSIFWTPVLNYGCKIVGVGTWIGAGTLSWPETRDAVIVWTGTEIWFGERYCETFDTTNNGFCSKYYAWTWVDTGTEACT